MFLPPRRVRSAVHQFLLQEIVPQFDELGGDLLPLASTSASQEAEDPKINMDLGDRLVIYKPPGWEVDTTISPGPSSGRLLSAFLRDVLPLGSLGASHQFGFLHRLDLPSSGLILVAKSHQAFYDLQLQLSTGTLQRDYMVLCHGWVSKQRHEIRAKVHWWKVLGLSNVPSAVLRSGRASVTFLQRLQRTQLAFSSACSLLAIRIGTGRRHQIRLHTAHVGHPVVADSQYAAKEVYRMDTRWCPRNFLHRFSLTFLGQGHESTTVLEVLPMDLRQVLWTATWRDVELELDSPLGTAPEKGHPLRDPSGSCFCGTSLKYAGFLAWGYP
ncbi:unnamed protein product [Cladocopium goreaui]|uniref:RNA pseudouridine synthase n=1 Tax=Cladocopium goreaui TaxID=2562237 RepID=A0A9P1C4K2_9DINO|nr:unnamed protein product [Cladocopium goreaui]